MSGAMNKQQKENAASALVEVCSVRVGETLFGVPISHILEIVGRTRPEPVPLAPEFVGGLIHYRGDVLTTVSLRQLLDMPNLDAPQDIMVLESPAGCYGLLVDSVGEVMRISDAIRAPNPVNLDPRLAAVSAGVYQLEGELLIVLDVDRVLEFDTATRAACRDMPAFCHSSCSVSST